MRIIFFGSSSFAIPSLESLLCSKEEILTVVTETDKPGGRSLQLQKSPVKLWAAKKRLPLLQPKDLKENSFLSELKSLKPDLLILISYGRILPPLLFPIFPNGGINVHPSVLPRYRGASPIPFAILNGDRETGISISRMTKEVDAGDILFQERVPIEPGEDTLQLSERLARLAAPLLVKAVQKIAKKEADFIPQKGPVSYAPKLRKEDGLVDWSKSAEALSNQIRAFVPWPGSFTYWRGKRLLIWKAEPLPGRKGGKPGEVLSLSKEKGLEVATGQGFLLLKEMQPEGKARMGVGSFLAGHPVHSGETFSCHP